MTISVTIQDLQPIFTKTVYTAETLRLNAAAGDDLTITNGRIEIDSTTISEGVVINYELLDFTNLFELKDKSLCQVTLADSFDLAALDTDGFLILPVKAFDVNNPLKQTFASIEIKYQVDRLPPVFKSGSTFDFHIEDPTFPGQSSVILELEASDGDEDINAPIGFEMATPPSDCMSCFDIEDNKVLWKTALPKDVIKKKVTQFEIRAFQKSGKRKETVQKIKVTFPGDELPPAFTEESYSLELKQSGEVSLATKIEAFDQDRYLDVEVIYQLHGSAMFDINQQTGDISSTDQFNASNLPRNGLKLQLLVSNLKVCVLKNGQTDLLSFTGFAN